MYWWGTKDRADRTVAANKIYTDKNKNTVIDGENSRLERLLVQARNTGCGPQRARRDPDGLPIYV